MPPFFVDTRSTFRLNRAAQSQVCAQSTDFAPAPVAGAFRCAVGFDRPFVSTHVGCIGILNFAFLWARCGRT
jgi:hypothetical protein